jgi:hypothetical protein
MANDGLQIRMGHVTRAREHACAAGLVGDRGHIDAIDDGGQASIPLKKGRHRWTRAIGPDGSVAEQAVVARPGVHIGRVGLGIKDPGRIPAPLGVHQDEVSGSGRPGIRGQRVACEGGPHCAASVAKTVVPYCLLALSRRADTFTVSPNTSSLPVAAYRTNPRCTPMRRIGERGQWAGEHPQADNQSITHGLDGHAADSSGL